MREHISQFKSLLAARRCPRTVAAYGRVMEHFADFVDARSGAGTERVGKETVEDFLARPRRDGGTRSPTCFNQELAALRAFFVFAQGRLGSSENPAASLLFRPKPKRDPAVLTAFEIRRLFVAAGELSPAPRRSLALAVLALLSQAALRVHELVALDLDQIDVLGAALLVVKGKGGTVHDLPLNSPAIQLLSAWIADRAKIAKPGERALFVSSRGTRLSVRAVQRLFVHLRGAIGTKKHVTPHTLRHSAATLALTQGTDLDTVSQVLRHSDINTTRLYLHLVDQRRREAVQRLATAIPESVLPQPSGNQTDTKASPDLRDSLDFQGSFDDIGEAA